MVEALWIVLVLIAVAVAAIVAFPFVVTQMEVQKKTNPQGVVKHDWLATGRIDFATRLEDINDQSKDKTGEFKLLVEERRIVESIAGNENLEIQWRLATLSEAKAVVTQYHKYLSENSLIKSIPDLAASPPSQPQLSVVASANEGSS
jgi:type II secretory pathway component PulK